MAQFSLRPALADETTFWTPRDFFLKATPDLAQRGLPLPLPSSLEPFHQPDLMVFVPLQGCKEVCNAYPAWPLLGGSWSSCCLQASAQELQMSQ